MNHLVKINGKDWPVIEWKGRRVITTAQLAELYEASEQQIQQNFNNNVKNFEEEKHYLHLQGKELKEFKNYFDDFDVVGKRAPHLYLWTHQGASRHCKILGTKKAWEQFDILEENYYNSQSRLSMDSVEQLIDNPDFGIKLLTALKEKKAENERLHTEIIKREERIAEMRPKEVFADAVTASQTSILVGDLAKLMKQNGVEIGAKRLFIWLRNNGYLIKRKGADWNMPTQKSMDAELFEIKESTHIDGNGCNITARTPKVTGKGQQYFINKFLEKENA